MKKGLFLAISMMLAFLAAGCVTFGGTGRTAGARVVGEDIQIGDITEFYYTYENINYNAFYQRYRFYTEDGKHLFFHETRERKDDYGPATEKDTTLTGTAELTDASRLMRNRKPLRSSARHLRRITRIL